MVRSTSSTGGDRDSSLFSLTTVATAAAVSGAAAVAGLALYHLNLSRRRRSEAPVRWSWLPWLGSALEMGKVRA